MKKILELLDITLKFDAQTVFEQISLAVTPGERIGVIGPSGHGKSLLLKLFAGLIQPDQGRVHHFDEPIDFWKRHYQDQARIQKRIGLLFQKNALFDNLTALENITFSLIESGKEAQLGRAKDIAHSLLEEVGLNRAAHLYPRELSGGMQKRLGLARLWALSPELILYDDPTAGLDPVTGAQIFSLIEERAQKEQSTVILVTNQINKAFELCHRIWFVYNKEVQDISDHHTHSHPAVAQFLRGDSRGPITF